MGKHVHSGFRCVGMAGLLVKGLVCCTILYSVIKEVKKYKKHVHALNKEFPLVQSNFCRLPNIPWTHGMSIAACKTDLAIVENSSNLKKVCNARA